MSAVEQSPLEVKARKLAVVGGTAGACLRLVLGLLDQSRADLDAARAEIDRLEALTLEQQRRVTLGGVPPGYHLPGAWENKRLEGGPIPEFEGLGDKP